MVHGALQGGFFLTCEAPSINPRGNTTYWYQEDRQEFTQQSSWGGILVGFPGNYFETDFHSHKCMRKAELGRGRSWPSVRLLLQQALELGWPFQVVPNWGRVQALVSLQGQLVILGSCQKEEAGVKQFPATEGSSGWGGVGRGVVGGGGRGQLWAIGSQWPQPGLATWCSGLIAKWKWGAPYPNIWQKLSPFFHAQSFNR